MKDLTKGEPSRLILAFAIPIFMANILQLTYSIVDTRIVGSYLGENSLAAVGATTTLSNLMIGFLMGLANGFAIITAQKFGARDYAGVKKSFALSIKMGCIIALAITVLCLLFLRQILGFLNVSNDLMGMAVSYIFIIIAGLVATFLYDACAAASRAFRCLSYSLSVLLPVPLSCSVRDRRRSGICSPAWEAALRVCLRHVWLQFLYL